MNPVVFRQALRQVRRMLIVLTVGAGAFFYLVLLSSSSFLANQQEAFSEFLEHPPKAVQALAGGSIDFLSPQGWLSSALTHPITMSLLIAAGLAVAANAVATEIERGTIDLVLVRPIGRLSFLLGKAGAVLVSVTAVELGGFLGVLLARATVARVGELSLAEVARAFLGSWVLFSAFGMLGLLVSARTGLRGRAIGIGVGIVVVTFFLRFIALLIDGLASLRFASPFHYFDPGQLIAGSSMWKLLVLLALGAVALAAAVESFGRRDLTR